MLARVAHGVGESLLMDKTWDIFQPVVHGGDCSIQAATKYISGYSDLLLGSITVNNDRDWGRMRCTCVTPGQYASPDDCWLALRGVRALENRLERHMKSALAVAEWFRSRLKVVDVLYPALPSACGHALKRDFVGACEFVSPGFQG